MPSACAACLLVLLLAGPTLADPPLADPPKKLNLESRPWGAPPVQGQYFLNIKQCRTRGFVQSIGKDGITLYWPAREVLDMRHDPVTGQLLELKKRTLPAVPAKTFVLGEDLAKGGYSGLDSDSYRVKDVGVGDLVDVHYDRRNGVDICKTIRIDRRPGGRVPPAPGEKPDAFHKHHEQANAHQDWEDFRTPYPRKYWPAYRGPDGKLYAGPYPSESSQDTPIPAPKP